MEYSDSKRQEQCKALSKLLNEQKYVDTTFVIGPQKTIFNVNRIFLASVSPVFAAMLFGKMKESELNSEVVIEDLQPSVFESVINFAYCNDPKIDEHNVIDVYAVADRYQIETLQKWCIEYFRSNLNENNLCQRLNQCIQLNLTTIITECHNFIEQTEGDKILKSDGFKNIDIKTMRELIKNDHFEVNEMTLWKSIVKWAEHNSSDDCKDDDSKMKEQTCTKLDLLKSVYDLVRFGLMTGAFFVANVIPENVLSKDETILILSYYFKSDGGCGSFNVKKRGELRLFPFRLEIEFPSQRTDNTYHALINSDMRKGCGAEKREDKQGLIRCYFDKTVRIRRFEIGPMVFGGGENIWGAKYLNKASIYASQNKSSMPKIRELSVFNENESKIIECDVTTNQIAIASAEKNKNLRIGLLKFYGTVAKSQWK